MAENSENIEARLCAYIEGELDEAGRQEIERHLESHPNHRRLITELTATRDLLRYLPREQAPVDLAEAFNAQLERSALLDAPPGESGAATIRANFLPRLLAMAAIVLLTCGLGAIVYFALPRGESRTQALNTTALTQPTEEGAAADADGADALRGAAPDVYLKNGEPATRGALADAGRTERLGKGGLPETVTNVGPRPVADALAKREVRREGKGGPSPEPVYVIVTAAGNQRDAVRETQALLSTNRIDWSAPDEEIANAPAPADEQAEPLPPQQQQLEKPQQQVSRAPQGQVQYRARGGSPSYARTELGNALQKKQQQQQQQQQQPLSQDRQGAGAAGAEQAPQPNAAPAPAAAAPPVQPDAKEFASANADASKTKQLASEPPAAASSAPAAPAAPTDAPAAIAGAQPGQTQQRLRELALKDQNAADVSGIRATMTRSQLIELAQTLNRSAQQVEVITDQPPLQVANEVLQQQKNQLGWAHQQANRTDKLDAAGSATGGAQAGPTTRPSPAARPTSGDGFYGQAPAPAKAAGPTTRRSDVNMKGGAGPTTAPSRQKGYGERDGFEGRAAGQADLADSAPGRGGTSDQRLADRVAQAPQPNAPSTTQPSQSPTTSQAQVAEAQGADDEPLDVVILVQGGTDVAPLGATTRPSTRDDAAPSDEADVPPNPPAEPSDVNPTPDAVNPAPSDENASDPVPAPQPQ
jgi:hypothetical protein